MQKLKAAIVGATGMAGQQFVQALSHHPWFEVTVMVSSRSAPDYRRALLEPDGASRWTQSAEVPDDMEAVPVVQSDAFDPKSVDVIFTAVESDVARELEPRFAATTPTFSTASAFRQEPDTPLMIPGVNHHHAELIRVQQRRRGWQGFVVPIPNCTVTGLAITLKPLADAFGLSRVLMVSMQAVSGAGRSPGVRTLDSLDNILPYIPKEEEKVRAELGKILGRVEGETVRPASIPINAICTRAAVLDGHTEAVFAGLERPATVEAVKAALREYRPFAGPALPSAPAEWIHVFEDPFRPQVRRDRDLGDGMTTSVGRVEPEPVLGGVKYVLVSHNTKMGAGKGAVLLAEALLSQGVFGS
ncbi:MAG: aspartate-semialdehyde dehydrogenase [Firmicutes bacterium]|nr:aspartate-semialdehyde dehydrogenase [Alicyclobacillaceae bacterium]MCL6497832.1 aspartate-semialdehyde dehydrogenase [Bacillota bacterium]